MFHLHELGWNSFFQQHVATGDLRKPARIVEEQRAAYRVACEAGILHAEISGRLRRAAEVSGFPAVGDWVLIDAAPGAERAAIDEILPRRSKFSRKAAGQNTSEQVVAANVDTAFIVTSLNRDFNERRIERYVAAIWDSGAAPVVILSKADICENSAAAIEAASAAAPGVPVYALSAITGEGLDQILEYLRVGRTAVLVGSSGAGKSTLINGLLGSDIQSVRHIREDDARGRHATTARRLFLLQGGGMLIDTPGMRELQLWDTDGGLDQTFEDIQELAVGCRFRDCGHDSEPGCAVREAVAAGTLSSGRLGNYQKMQQELAFLERKRNVLTRIEETRKWKQIRKSLREHYKYRR